MPRGAPPFKFENLLPYYSGAYFASVTIKARLAAAGYVEAAREVTAYQEMLTEFREAIQQTAKLHQAREKAAAEPTSG